MAMNHKFGQVTLEHPGQVKDDEPVFIFAAHDKYTLAMVMAYFDMQALAGASDDFLADLEKAAEEIAIWQEANGLLEPRGL